MSDEYFSAPAGTSPTESQPAPVWELSGWWRRVGASVIDYFVVWIPVSIVLGLIGVGADARTNDELPNELDGVSWLLVLVVSAVYFMVTMSAWKGQTVGKRVTGIRVVRESGEPMSAMFAFVRQTLVIAILFDSLAIILLFIPTLLNYLWPLWDEKHQALHDKMVNSRVVRAYPVSDPGSLQAVQQDSSPAAPFPVGTPSAPPPPPRSAPPAPPAPGGVSTPYTPPPGFENPVPEDD